MRSMFAKLAVAAAAAGLIAGPLAAAPRLTGEARLAKMIEGRSAGEARSCVPTLGANDLTVIDRTALVYRSGGKLWVNRTLHPEDIDDDAIMVIDRFDGANLCRQDTIRLVDRLTGMFRGVIFLGDFVPYTKAI